jgi:hypothetical protein
MEQLVNYIESFFPRYKSSELADLIERQETLFSKIQHRANPLHVYCRACDISDALIPFIPRKQRRQFCESLMKGYEKRLFLPLFGNGHPGAIPKVLKILRISPFNATH